MHICRHGYDFCKMEHFLELCSERPYILSHSIVEDRADPQNVFMAIKFFSLPVQCYMLSKGYAETAHFIKLIRNWFRACNEQGIRANERVEYWYDTHEFLTISSSFHPNYAVAMSKVCLSRHLKPYCRYVLHAYTCIHLLLTRHTTPEVCQHYSPKVTFVMSREWIRMGRDTQKGQQFTS